MGGNSPSLVANDAATPLTCVLGNAEQHLTPEKKLTAEPTGSANILLSTESSRETETAAGRV